jgi:hypothetical protein
LNDSPVEFTKIKNRILAVPPWSQIMHPHPASVHFPIAYIVLSNSLKLGNAWRLQLFSTLLPDLNIPKAAFYLQTIDLLTAVPAALTGV